MPKHHAPSHHHIGSRRSPEVHRKPARNRTPRQTPQPRQGIRLVNRAMIQAAAHIDVPVHVRPIRHLRRALSHLPGKRRRAHRRAEPGHVLEDVNQGANLCADAHPDPRALRLDVGESQARTLRAVAVAAAVPEGHARECLSLEERRRRVEERLVETLQHDGAALWPLPLGVLRHSHADVLGRRPRHNRQGRQADIHEIAEAPQRIEKLTLKLELHNVESVRGRSHVRPLEDNIPDGRLGEMHLDVMRRQEQPLHLIDQRPRRIPRRDERVQSARNLLRRTPRRLLRELSMPEPAQQLQRQRKVDAPGITRPRQRPPRESRPQLVEHAARRLRPVEYEHELPDGPLEQQRDLPRELLPRVGLVRVVVEPEELVPEAPREGRQEAVQDDVEVGPDTAVREVVVREEELAAEAVGEGLCEGGDEGACDEGRDLDLDVVGW
ncbi:hypothetical protein CCMA1212_000446 [Trichoderma ghanense]|uniref:Uncharacterized protein n=1 Tax=Trichoderma ghanense TaxID=65468 RepID=A0ABY2HFJ9_9HYPO